MLNNLLQQFAKASEAHDNTEQEKIILMDSNEEEFHLVSAHPKIYNLVLMGGGVKGVAHVGALDFLSQHQLLNDLKAVVGTSAGSLVALLIALKVKLSEIRRVMSSIEFKDLKDDHHWIKALDLKDLYKNYGICKAKKLEKLVN